MERDTHAEFPGHATAAFLFGRGAAAAQMGSASPAGGIPHDESWLRIGSHDSPVAARISHAGEGHGHWLSAFVCVSPSHLCVLRVPHDGEPQADTHRAHTHGRNALACVPLACVYAARADGALLVVHWVRRVRSAWAASVVEVAPGGRPPVVTHCPTGRTHRTVRPPSVCVCRAADFDAAAAGLSRADAPDESCTSRTQKDIMPCGAVLSARRGSHDTSLSEPEQLTRMASLLTLADSTGSERRDVQSHASACACKSQHLVGNDSASSSTAQPEGGNEQFDCSEHANTDPETLPQSTAVKTADLETAADAIRRAAGLPEWQQRRRVVVVLGPRTAPDARPWHACVAPMLGAAGVRRVRVVRAQYVRHAEAIVRHMRIPMRMGRGGASSDESAADCAPGAPPPAAPAGHPHTTIVAVGDDALADEVIAGLLARPDWREARRHVALALLPAKAQGRASAAHGFACGCGGDAPPSAVLVGLSVARGGTRWDDALGLEGVPGCGHVHAGGRWVFGPGRRAVRVRDTGLVFSRSTALRMLATRQTNGHDGAEPAALDLLGEAPGAALNRRASVRSLHRSSHSSVAAEDAPGRRPHDYVPLPQGAPGRASGLLFCVVVMRAPGPEPRLAVAWLSPPGGTSARLRLAWGLLSSGGQARLLRRGGGEEECLHVGAARGAGVRIRYARHGGADAPDVVVSLLPRAVLVHALWPPCVDG